MKGMKSMKNGRGKVQTAKTPQNIVQRTPRYQATKRTPLRKQERKLRRSKDNGNDKYQSGVPPALEGFTPAYYSVPV
jgi:hypothetical protein